MRKVIGIDLGTTSISSVVMDTDAKEVLESRTIGSGHFLESAHVWERAQNAEEILANATEIIKKLLELHPDVQAIGIDCQMHGIVYLDDAGKVISPLYTWQDARGNEIEEEGKSLVEIITERTGLFTAAGYGLVTHIYNLRHHLVPAKAVTLCTIGDALGLHLTSESKPILHSSNAASLGFYNVREHCFHREELQAMGADPAVLPKVQAANAFIGTYRGIPVSLALGDNQASFLGAAGSENSTLLVNIGTGSQLSFLSSEYVEVDGMEPRPFFDQSYLLAGSGLCGGRAYAMMEKFFRNYTEAFLASEKKTVEKTPQQYIVMENLARAARERRLKIQEQVTIDPRFCGSRENPALRGSITGISENNFEPGEWILALQEGMVKELHQYAINMQDKGILPEKLVVSGNAIRRNSLLRELIEEIFGMETVMSSHIEEAACGAAMSAAELLD